MGSTFALLFLVAILGSTCSSVPAPSGPIVLVGDEHEFRRALNTSSKAVIILLTKDIILSWNQWGPVRDNPLRLTKNITIQSALMERRRAILDFNYLTSILRVTRRNTLTLGGIEIRGTFSRLPMDFLAPNDDIAAYVRYDNVVVMRKVCGDMRAHAEAFFNMSRPAQQGGASIPQSVSQPTTWCYEHNNTVCFNQSILITDLGTHFNSGLGSVTHGGYELRLLNTSLNCEAFVDKTCTDQQGVGPCLDEANRQLVREAQNKERQPPSEREWVVPVTIAAGTTGGVVIMGVVMWYLLFRRWPRRWLYGQGDAEMQPWSKERGYVSMLPDDITLGLLLGSGSTGRVYQGSFRGQKVAIKIILHSVREAEKVTQELEVNMSFDHVNIVRALHIARVEHQNQRRAELEREEALKKAVFPRSAQTVYSPGNTASAPHSSFPSASTAGFHVINLPHDGSTSSHPTTSSSFVQPVMEHMSSPDLEMWLVLELCDRGTLSQAVGRKDFMDDKGAPRMQAILLRLMDIARGMAYVHARNICHGDLKCENVMLSTDYLDPYGVVAKIADFGLARALKVGQSHLSTQGYGTVTHMPPELLLSGQLRPACDVYSFGIMMWEMAMARRPFIGVTHGEIVRMVVIDDLRPSFEVSSSSILPCRDSQLSNVITQEGARVVPVVSGSEIESGAHAGATHVSNAFTGYFDDYKASTMPKVPQREAARATNGPLRPTLSLEEVSLSGIRVRAPASVSAGHGPPAEYIQLAQDCWTREPSKRPSFQEVLKRLETMLTNL